MGQESERVSAASGGEKAGKKRKKEEHESCRNIGRGMYVLRAGKKTKRPLRNTDLPGRYLYNYYLYIHSYVCMYDVVYVYMLNK